MDPLSLDGNDEQLHPMSRLRSIARYETFQPRALALSPPVPLSYTGFESSASQKPTGESSTIRRSPQADTNKGSGGGNSGGMTSLGAVAGSHGVALFRLTKPQVPILILSHASNSVLKSGAVSSLAFQPDNSRYMHLAAARGSGVLVWDVSGHTLSPLVGRVSSGLDDESQIISLAWKPSADGTPWLAATTSSSACLWDLREPSGYTMFKPSLRFGVTRKQGAGNLPVAPYVQVACSDRDECALLDAAGTLRVFDTRMTDRTRSSTGALSSFSSFQHAGVGLAYMQSESDDTHWVTWGLESSTSNAVVKVWRSCTESADSVVGDDYWLMDGLPERSSSGLKPFGYKLAGKCTTPNLACARVCPSPIKNSIVTVGLDQKEPGGPASWRADLWKLAEPANDSEESALVKIISFDGGRETDKHLSSMLGPDARQGLLRASELAFSSYPTFFQQLKGDKSKGVGKSEISSEFGLLLCNLSENGYITTHVSASTELCWLRVVLWTPLYNMYLTLLLLLPMQVIPEALPHDLTKDDEKVTPSAGEGSTHTRVFPTDNAAAIKDPARLWGSHGEMLTLGIDVRAGREHQDTSGAQAAFEGGMPFDMEVPVAYSIAAGGITGVQLAGVSDMTSSNIPQTGTSDSEDNDQTGADARAAVALMENIDADRIPCPRLCGAAFGTGIGGLVTFHNGEVGKMWQWFQQTGSNRLSAVPGSIGEPSVAATGGAEKAIELISQDGAGGGQATSKTCPRSLQDLIDMTSAAKEAQWGEQENDSEGGSSNNGRILGDNFFDDDSESSSEQPEDVSEDLGEGVDSKNKKALYESYFGDVRGATETGESAGESERKLSDRKTSNHVVGPSSDTLAPVVQVSHEFDRIALNNQSLELAKAWQLGEWASTISDDDFPEDQVGSAMMDLSERSRGSVVGKAEEYLGSPLTPPRRGTGLTSYRALLPSPDREVKPIHRSTSSPALKAIVLPGTVKSVDGDEPGVHGGEYSVRPNMQESMVFLRKLFTHQQGGAEQRGLFSPPDSPMRKCRHTSESYLVGLNDPNAKALTPPYCIPSISQFPTACWRLQSEQLPWSRRFRRSERNLPRERYWIVNSLVCTYLAQRSYLRSQSKSKSCLLPRRSACIT
jgi:hypothetical protein